MKCKHLIFISQGFLEASLDIMTSHIVRKRIFNTFGIIQYTFLQIKKKTVKYSGNFGIKISKKGPKIIISKIMNRLGTITGIYKVLSREQLALQQNLG